MSAPRAAPALALAALVSVAAACASTAPEGPFEHPDAVATARDAALDEARPLAPCSAGLASCGARCVSLADDPLHCGVCDRACGPGAGCARGRCQCAAGASALCGGVCADTRNDPQNCGACGLRCAAGDRCAAGACVTPPCPEGASRCDGVCAATDTNPERCGVCGRRCSSSERCVLGQCRPEPCPAGTTRCGRACVDTQRDPRACGRCDRACGPEGRCVGGACVDVRCGAGETACDGACHDVRTSLQHCGACGVACPACSGATVECVDGACELRLSCGAGQSRCLGSPGDACTARCVDLESDPAHCGACRFACAPTQACSAGRCVAVRCEAGFAQCGRACVALDTSHGNCGACGRACDPRASCRRGVCAFPPCNAGHERCDGACANLASDPAHCGACGARCATGRCVAGRCAPLACAQGLVACGARCVDPREDPAHCGGCDAPCASPSACFQGVCARPDPAVRYRIAPSTRAWLAVCDTPAARSHPLDLFQQFTEPEPLPFAFLVYGAPARSYALDLNGIVYFGAPRVLYAEIPALPSTEPPRPALYAIGNRQLTLREGRVCTLTEGAAPARRFVIEYRVADTNSPTNFPFDVEVVLEEGTGVAHLLYRLLAGGTLPGDRSTVALLDATGTAATVYAQRDDLALYDGLALRFAPVE